MQCTHALTGDGGQQSLGHFGDDDADGEDEVLQDVAADGEADDEEDDADGDRHHGDGLDELVQLDRQRRLRRVGGNGHVRNARNDGVVARAKDHGGGGALDHERAEEGEVGGLLARADSVAGLR